VNDLASSSNVAARWFAVQVRPRAEKFVAKLLSFKGYEQFLPLYRARNRWSDRTKDIDLPLFPGYVFSRMDASVRGSILTTPGVIRIVGNGHAPVSVEDSEIRALQKIVVADIVREPWPFVEVGQRVHITAGPLCGLEGLVLRVRNDWRLVVSVSLLQRSVSAEIDRTWIAL
jgi:transcription antitermination factor NusG